MNKWKHIRLGDICTIERGGSPRPIKNYITDRADGINWIKIGDTSPDSMYITSTKEKILPEGMSKSRFVKSGDFLLTNSMSFGRPYILKVDGCIHDGWLVLKDEKKFFDKQFLYYLLNSDYIYSTFKNMAVGGVVNNLNSQMVRNLELDVPVLDLQKEIVKVLDKAQDLIYKRKEQIKYLDELVKSKFIEMFGAPNEKKFNGKTLPEVITEDKYALKRGPFGGSLKKDDFIQEGYLVYEQRHAIHNDFEYAKYFISEKKYEEMIMFKVESKDLLVSCSGVTLGRISEVPEGAKAGIINQALLKITLNQNIMNNIYFMQLFRNEQIQDKLFGFSRGSGIPNFPSMNEVKSMEFLCPPIELQNKFAYFVQQVDKLKFEMENSLKELQNNFDSLMQKAFKGELFN